MKRSAWTSHDKPWRTLQRAASTLVSRFFFARTTSTRVSTRHAEACATSGPMTPSPLRWRMISLAFWATVVNYLDRQTLSVAAPVLQEHFHISDQAYSW